MQLTAVGLGHSFTPGTFLFRNLDFVVESREVVAVTGPSGSGKSSLLALVAGWLQPTEGTLSLSDLPNITWVPQSPLGVADRCALDHVSVSMIATGLTRSVANQRALMLLERFGLGEAQNRPFRYLSGGERQRLMLARAVACRANVILVDEPTAQLDRVNAEATIETLTEIADQDGIVLIATHDPRVEQRCTRSIDLAER